MGYFGIIKSIPNFIRTRTEKGYYRFMLKEAEKPVTRELLNKIYKYPGMNKNTETDFRYQFTRLSIYDDLNRLYPLREKAGKGETFSRALNLMEWFCMNTKYSGYSTYNIFKPKNQYLKLMEYAFKNKFSHAINCAAKAIAFSDCLMALGIYALPVWISNAVHDKKDCSFGYSFCHVVVHVYLPEEGRWVMLDPSLDAYLTDESGKTLDLIEIYERTARKESLKIARYHLNGSQFFKDKYLSGFFQPCLFEFLVWKGNAPELRDLNCPVYLVPDSFNQKEYLKALAKKHKTNKFYTEALKNMTLISQEQFLAKPEGNITCQ